MLGEQQKSNMEASVRHRVQVGGKYQDCDSTDEYTIVSDSHKVRTGVGAKYWIIFIVIQASIFGYIHHKHHNFPLPLDTSSAKTVFSEGRARSFLTGLTSIGFRPAGSRENEVEAVAYILKELDQIKRKAKDRHDIQIDLQQTSGSFSLHFLDDFTHFYENVQNIVARIGPNGGANDSLLVNCHFDSVIGSPGKSI